MEKEKTKERTEERNDDLTERYLYDVVRRLPEKQKKDIEKELRTLIEDMIAEQEEAGETDREKCTKSVLNSLGSPAKLARSYRGENDCLIGGEYYGSYCYILKIVLICTAVGIFISNVVSSVVQVVETEENAVSLWSDMLNIEPILPALIQVFGVITLIYALMERKHVKVNVGDAEWSLEKLPHIPYKKATISRGESVVGIVFGILCVILFIFAPQLIGAWIQEGDSYKSVPLFNPEIWRQVQPLFLLSFAAGITDDFVKLVAGRYTYTVMTVTIIADTVSFALACLIFKGFPIWNADFVPEIEKLTGKIISSGGDILLYFNTGFFSNIFLLFLLFCFLLDMGTTVYYTVRYGEKRNG